MRPHGLHRRCWPPSTHSHIITPSHTYTQRLYARQNPAMFTYLSEVQSNLHTPYPVATVFGASGYIGKYICCELARVGYQVITPYRFAEHSVMEHRVMGDVGQVVGIHYSSRNYKSILDICARSNVVVSAVGRDYLRPLDATRYTSNVEVPKMIAQACADTNVNRFFLISHQGADPNSSDSQFLREKGLAEKYASDIYPEVTILRPNIVCGGSGDRLSTLFARWNRSFAGFFLIQGGQHVFQPIFVGNVADAVVQALKRPYTIGQQYELSGPQKMTYHQYALKVQRVIGVGNKVVSVPRPLAKAFASANELINPFTPHFTQSLVEKFSQDIVQPPSARNTIQSLGILPAPIDHVIDRALGAWVYDPDVAGGAISYEEQ